MQIHADLYGIVLHVYFYFFHSFNFIFMKYLLVVAHPDDEVLGAGASMWKWCKNGDTVDVAIMCTEAKARAFRPDD